MTTDTEKKPGVGKTAIAKIIAGFTNEEVLAAVHAAHPTNKTSTASMNWYRNKLRSEGNTMVKTNRDLKKAQKAAKAIEAEATEADPFE
jgi:replication-associated recombination protein RarA